MKKFFSTILVVMAAALAFSACQKNETGVQEPGLNATTVNFQAVAPDTKATFGEGYAMNWSGTEKVKVTTGFTTATMTEADVDADGAFSAAIEDEAPYRFYAAVPASAVYNVSNKYWDWNFTVPAAQTPGKNTPDEAAVILYAQSDSLDAAPTDAIKLQFHHLLSYGVLNVKNLKLASGEAVSSIAVTFEQPVAGGLYLYPLTGETSAHHSSNTITLTSSETANLWFSLIPQADLSGSDLTVTVTTDKGTEYTKTATFPDEGVTFAAGAVNKINVDFTGVNGGAEEFDFTTIAELNALATSTAQAGLKGNVKDVVVSYVNGKNAFLEDATGATLLFLNDHGLTQGQKINGKITVTLTTYHSCSELTALDTKDATITEGATIPCTTKTLAELTAEGALAKYQSMRIKVVGVDVADGIAGSDRNGSMTQNGTTMALYAGVNNLAGVSAGANADIIGFVAYYNAIQLAVYSDDDITVNSSKTEATLTLDPTSLSLEIGKTGTITATTNSDATVVWTSSNEAVATVKNGVVTAVAAGSAKITASVAETANFTAAEASANVVVSDPSATTKSDVITIDKVTWAATTNGYQNWTYTGNANYAGQSNKANDIAYIQLRSKNSNSGIVSTTSAGKVASVEIVFNPETTFGTSETGTDLSRYVDVYGSNTAYTAATELYDSATQGTKIGSVSYDGTTVKYVVTPDADYEYVGLRSKNGAVYLDSVTITWK